MSRVDDVEAPPADVNLDRVWANVAGEIWAPEPSTLERLLVRIGLPRVISKVMATTPSLRFSWIVATAVLLTIGVFVTRSTDQPWVALLAPALCAISVAFAFGPGVDPAFEVAQTTPVSDRMILLARTVGVVMINAVLGIVASLFSAVAWEITFSWLLPMAAIAGLALAVAMFTGSPLAGAGSGQLVWMTVIAANAYQSHDLTDAILVPELRVVYIIVALFSFVSVLWISGDMRWKQAERWI